jgi:hypothetical protein
MDRFYHLPNHCTKQKLTKDIMRTKQTRVINFQNKVLARILDEDMTAMEAQEFTLNVAHEHWACFYAMQKSQNSKVKIVSILTNILNQKASLREWNFEKSHRHFSYNGYSLDTKVLLIEGTKNKKA